MSHCPEADESRGGERTRTLIIIHRTDGATAYNGRRMDSTGSASDFEPIRERIGEGLHAVFHVDFVACDAGGLRPLRSTLRIRGSEFLAATAGQMRLSDLKQSRPKARGRTT